MSKNFDSLVNQIWMDLDGVIYDFDLRAYELLGMMPKDYERKFGSDKFWEAINETSNGNFFYQLKLIDSGVELYNIIKANDFIVPFLSGSPSQLGDKARADKFRRVETDFGLNQRLAVCQSKNKYLYCKPGDVIIDDTSKYKSKWEDAGGIFILHSSNQLSTTIDALTDLGVIT